MRRFVAATRATVPIAIALTVSACAGNSAMSANARDVPFAHPDAPSDTQGDPRLYVFVTDERTGEGLPCKLTLRGVDGTATPDWPTASWRAAHPDAPLDQVGEWVDYQDWALGSGQWVLMARGRAVVALPPGRYALTVTRGAEYAALDLGVHEVTADHGAVASGVLHRVVETEGEIAAEFHVHSAPSFDSDVPLDQRVLSLAVEGVEAFASTDHDALGDFAPAVAALGLERYVHWIRGDEITADGFGHFGAFPLPEGVDPAVSLTHDEPSVAEIVARARAVIGGGVIQLNHPLWKQHPIGYWAIAGFDPATGHAATELFSAFDAVEVWNGHTLDEDDPYFVGPDDVIAAWMSTLQLGRGATATGNTDTHRLARTPPGWPRNYLRVPNDDPAQVTDAMITAAVLSGDSSLTSGPFLRATVGGRRPGQIVPAVAGVATVHVEVQAPTWTPVDRVELIANRIVVATLDVTAAAVDGARRQVWDVPVALHRDAWIVARTRAAEPVSELAGVHHRPLPSLALVNPIYVDYDGDGAWTPPGIDGGP